MKFFYDADFEIREANEWGEIGALLLSHNTYYQTVKLNFLIATIHIPLDFSLDFPREIYCL